jgi:hypothetical protein
MFFEKGYLSKLKKQKRYRRKGGEVCGDLGNFILKE